LTDQQAEPRQRFQRLAAVIRADIDRLDRLVAEAASSAALFDRQPPSPLELRGLGDILHDFYTGAERLFERISPVLNGGIPETRSWHRDLLETMTIPLPGVRPAVLDRETARMLDEYLRFRHLFRNTYGYELEWSRLRPLFEGLAGAWQKLRGDMTRFLGFVDQLGNVSP
jgi:hypothetical protein